MQNWNAPISVQGCFILLQSVKKEQHWWTTNHSYHGLTENKQKIIRRAWLNNIDITFVLMMCIHGWTYNISYNLKFTTKRYNHWGCGNLESQYGPASLHHQTSIWACLQPSWLCQKGQKSPEEHVDSGTAPPKYRIRPIKLPRWLYPILPKDKEIARSTILKLKRKFHSHEKEKTWKVHLQKQDFVLKSPSRKVQ